MSTLSTNIMSISAHTRSSAKVIHTSLGRSSTHNRDLPAVAGLWIWNAGHEDVISSESDEESNWNSLRSDHLGASTGHNALQAFSEFDEDEEMDALEENSFHFDIEDVRKSATFASERSNARSIDTCSRSVDTFAYDDDIVASFDDTVFADEVVLAVSGVAQQQGHRRTFEDQRANLAITIASELCSRASEDGLSLAESDDADSVQEYSLPDDDLKPRPPPSQEDEESSTDFNSDSDYLHSPGSLSKYVVRMARSPKKQQGHPPSTNSSHSDSSVGKTPRVVEDACDDQNSDHNSLIEVSAEFGLDQKRAAVVDFLSEIAPDTLKSMELPTLTDVRKEEEPPSIALEHSISLQDCESSSLMEHDKSSSYEEIEVTSTHNYIDQDCDENDTVVSFEDDMEEMNDEADANDSNSYTEITVDDGGLATSQDSPQGSFEALMEVTVDEPAASEMDVPLGHADDSGRASRDTAGEEAKDELVALLQKLKSDFVKGVQRGDDHGTITLNEHFTKQQNSVVDDMRTDEESIQSMESAETASSFSLTIRPALVRQISALTTQSFSKRSKHLSAEQIINITGTATSNGSTISIQWKKVVAKPRMNAPGRKNQGNPLHPKKSKLPPWSQKLLEVVAEDEVGTSPESRKVKNREKSGPRKSHTFIGTDPEAAWTKVKAKKGARKRRSRPWKSDSNIKVAEEHAKRSPRPTSVPDLKVILSGIPISGSKKTTIELERSQKSLDIHDLSPSKLDSVDCLHNESATTNSTVDSSNLTPDEAEPVSFKAYTNPLGTLEESERSARTQDIHQEIEAKLEELNVRMGRAAGVQQSSESESQGKKKASLSEKHAEVKSRREKLRRSFSNVLRGSQRKVRRAFSLGNTRSKSMNSL